jgi:catechol 2,3-dioxygenase-like lactoylglutathione lyase family enzyme
MSDKIQPALSGARAGALVPVNDLDRAVAFYQDVLGLAAEQTPGSYRMRAGDGTVLYFLAGTGDAGNAGWPIGSFETDDIESAVDDLTARGVTFNRDVPFDQDERGISNNDGMRVAWFGDPDGNLFTIFQLT